MAREMEKMRFRRGNRHQSLIIYQPIKFTTFSLFYYSFFGEYASAEGVEKRGKRCGNEEAWMERMRRCGLDDVVEKKKRDM